MPATARRNPLRFHLLTGLALSLLGTLALWLTLSRGSAWPQWLACWLVSVNVVTFGYYGYDKGRARSRGLRVPELALHGLSAAGGSVGAYAGMQAFRHKTVKGKFRILFWCIVVLQVLLAAYVAKLIWM